MNNEMMNNDAITTKKIVIDGSLITTKEEFYDFVTCLGTALPIIKNSKESEETSTEVGVSE